MMNSYLIVIDMQNDFIDGALGTSEAVSIVPKVKKKLEDYDGTVIFTRDTHGQEYLNTAEGKKLPVTHCIKGTHGWEICDELKPFCKSDPLDKSSFGSLELSRELQAAHAEKPIDEIILVGLCTDICVISNGMIIKAALPEVRLVVDSECCAGVTPQSHQNALAAMRACQIDVM